MRGVFLTRHLYRICPEAFLEDFRGLGASFEHGGRWNPPGIPALYFACSAATALLEMAQYLPSPRLVPAHYRLGVFALPARARIDTLHANEWPADRVRYPYPPSTQAIGEQWLRRGAALALFLPSAAVPGGLEQIALVNPAHPQAAQLQLLAQYHDLYPARMFSR